MKKRFFTAFVSLLMIFVFAGCSNSSSSNQSASNGNGNRAGFQKPDVYGEVSAISGNTVTLKLMNMPQFNRQNRRGQGGGRGSGTGNMGAQNNPGNGNGGGNGNWRGNGNGGPGGGMRARSYTGQVKTITIPNGVQMTTMSRGTNGVTQTAVTLSDLTVGSTLSIYYDTDGKTIKSIRVQKPWTGNGQAGTGSNGQAGSTGNAGNGQAGSTTNSGTGTSGNTAS
jgi:hypothetical protein